MRRIDAYQTADGELFTTRERATRHADERFGAVLTKHAHKLAAIEKYTDALAYLEREADSLATLAALKADRDTIEGEE